MITHVVLFKPRQSLEPAWRGEILQTVVSGLRSCPTVRGFRIGRRVLHGLPGYEQAMAEDFQFVLILEFDDLQGLIDYLRHPNHDALGSLFSKASAAALAYDYDMLPTNGSD